jgi:glycosyltransferase involved in cell wall biosynthesis
MQTDTPRVSIITVCLNAGARIEATAVSVAAQQGCAFEWLVVDGVSTDDTVERVKLWEGKMNGAVRLISELDNGIYDAMNKGLGMARGEWVFFLNAGDELAAAGSLAALLTGCVNPHIGLITGRVRQVDPENGYTLLVGQPFALESVALGRIPPHQACMYRRTDARDAGGYPTGFGMASDTVLTLKIAQDKGAAFVGETVSIYPADGVSSRFDWRWRVHRDKARAIRAAAPDWVWRRYRWRWPVEALRATASHLLRQCGLLGVWRRIKRGS